jgi:probable HAF family extracellular repeat protein
MVGLGFLPTGGDSSIAWDVSGDGSTVVGENRVGTDSRAFRWTSGGGMAAIGDLAGGATGSSAKGISSSGAAIVGWSFSENGREAFRWTSAGGMVGLGDIPGGGFESIAEAVSADGSVVVGAGFADSGLEAFIWDANGGMRNLRSALMNDYGLQLTGWRLTSARGVSADGLTIVGDGVNPESNLEAWMVKLPAENDIVVPANSTRVFSNVRANSLTLVGENSLAVVVDNGGNDATSAIGTLTIGPASKLDLNDNDLVIRSTAAEKNAEHAAIQEKIVSAQNGFDENFVTKWDGPGITSSAARDVNVAAYFDLIGLGVIRNSDLEITTGVPGSTYATFSGQAVTPDDILVKYTYSGDGNLDGVITFDDYAAMDAAFFGTINNLGWATGDINFDGVINFDDYAVVDRAFFYPGIPLSHVDVSAVPEPTAWLTALMAFIALPMCVRRLTTARPENCSNRESRNRLRGISFRPGVQVVGPAAMAEFAKALRAFAGGFEIQKQRHERRHDLLEPHQVLVDKVHPVAQKPSADEDCVTVGRLAYQPDVAVIRPGAAVGAAGHAHGELFAVQAELGQLDLELIDHAR